MKKFAKPFKSIFIIFLLVASITIYAFRVNVLDYAYLSLMFIIATGLYSVYIISINNNKSTAKELTIVFFGYIFQMISVALAITVGYSIAEQNFHTEVLYKLALILVFFIIFVMSAIRIYELRKENINLSKTLELINLEWIKENRNILILSIIPILSLIIVLGAPALIFVLFIFIGTITFILSLAWLKLMSLTNLKLRKVNLRKISFVKPEPVSTSLPNTDKLKKKKKKKTKSKKSYS